MDSCKIYLHYHAISMGRTDSKFSLRLNEPCGRMACAPCWVRSRKDSLKLSDLECWLVWQGHGWMQTQNREYELRPGFCVFMRPGGIYDAQQNEDHPLGITFIHFDLLRDKEVASLPEAPFQVSDLLSVDHISKRIVSLYGQASISSEHAYRRKRLEAAGCLLQGLLLVLVGEIEDRKAHPLLELSAETQALINSQCVRIEEDPANYENVVAMAQEAGMSSAHYSRTFKLVAGISASDYMIQTRISRASMLLMETSLAVGAIAEQVGYRDIYFFSRQFKQRTGLPPSAFRRQTAKS